MSTNQQATPKRLFNTRDITVIGLMIALTVVMLNTPLGVITLPMIRITIAHVPILITAVLFGLPQALIVALAFGTTSLIIAATQPVSVLDPFFVNPLISILPRLLIPVTAYFSYKALGKLLRNVKAGQAIAVAASLAIGNLTNTFGVYTMLYLVYARDITEATGTPAVTLIIGLISTSTAIKCAAIVLICTPVVMGLKKALKNIWK